MHGILEGEVERLNRNPKPLYSSRATHRNLAILGGPGSGKGTQAEQLSRWFKTPHISTGDLFRENLERHTALGNLAESYMQRGELVPDSITDAAVSERLSHNDASSGFILDGFPRTVSQAEALSQMLATIGSDLTAAIYIRVPDEEIISRLSGRLICRVCHSPFHVRFNPPKKPGLCDVCGGALYQREDDNPETVRTRIKRFHEQMEPLEKYYNERSALISIDGHGSVDQVSNRIRTALRLGTDCDQ